MMGDWKKGEASAQSGFGQRVGDATTRPNGGNCYACHQMTKKELSYGTLGPSLLGYGKVRGNSLAMVKYTYEKIYNPHIYSGCSNMPRFGHNGILTPEQIADAVALLLDPKSEKTTRVTSFSLPIRLISFMNASIASETYISRR